MLSSNSSKENKQSQPNTPENQTKQLKQLIEGFDMQKIKSQITDLEQVKQIMWLLLHEYNYPVSKTDPLIIYYGLYALLNKEAQENQQSFLIELKSLIEKTLQTSLTNHSNNQTTVIAAEDNKELIVNINKLNAELAKHTDNFAEHHDWRIAQLNEKLQLQGENIIEQIKLKTTIHEEQIKQSINQFENATNSISLKIVDALDQSATKTVRLGKLVNNTLWICATACICTVLTNIGFIVYLQSIIS